MPLTSVADHAHRGRGEDEDAFSQQGELPQDHDLLPEEADELGHAACRVGDLQPRNPQLLIHQLEKANQWPTNFHYVRIKINNHIYIDVLLY